MHGPYLGGLRRGSVGALRVSNPLHCVKPGSAGRADGSVPPAQPRNYAVCSAVSQENVSLDTSAPQTPVEGGAWVGGSLR